MKRIVDYFRSLVLIPRRRNITLGVLVLVVASVILEVPEPHVSLAAEPLFQNGPTWFTNALFSTLLVDVVIIILAIAARASLKEVPTGFGNFVEFAIEGLYNLTESVAGNNARRFFPIAATIFIFVIFSNYVDVLPGVGSIGVWHAAEGRHAATLGQQVASTDLSSGLAALFAPARVEEGGRLFVSFLRPPSADLNMTLALALIVMVMVQYYGARALGASYFKKFFNFGGKGFMGAIFSVVGILELVSEIAKVISFSFRLFGNIFAGEVLLAVMAFLFAFLLPVPFFGLEFFVGFIQALVFMMLAIAFFSTAMIGHDEQH